MRLTWLIVVGIAAVGCKDRQAAKSAEATAHATPGSGSTVAQPQPRPPAPTLPPDELFAGEGDDSVWGRWAEDEIHRVAPQLTEVACKHTVCRATVTATTEAELVAATEKLQTPESLMAAREAQSLKLTQPVARDGKLAMTIYLRFDRHVEDPPAGPE